MSFALTILTVMQAAVAGPPAPGAVDLGKAVRSLRCERTEDGDEIVVCGRMRAESPYRYRDLGTYGAGDTDAMVVRLPGGATIRPGYIGKPKVGVTITLPF